MGNDEQERLMPRFDPLPGGGVVAHLDTDEARLLRELIREMRVLLEADIPLVDPVVARLFPDAYEDEEDAASYREMTGDQLREGKLQALSMVAAQVGERGPITTDVDADQVEAWLTLMTDMRLAIGTRLDITEEKMESDIDPGHPDGPALSVLHWLGWLQETMLAAAMEDD